MLAWLVIDLEQENWTVVSLEKGSLERFTFSNWQLDLSALTGNEKCLIMFSEQSTRQHRAHWKLLEEPVFTDIYLLSTNRMIFRSVHRNPAAFFLSLSQLQTRRCYLIIAMSFILIVEYKSYISTCFLLYYDIINGPLGVGQNGAVWKMKK